ncbi:hypothetical protein CERSUDRAFT_97034 [Gelatoporia subvermispora B]|uniref:PIH1 N-terminal domain-containing protein n=1 Tax=Ceriporiopsis subvermispora (strain B) TaxID=914234 RepID=M2QDJ9_CERS8|nr:hypothetical protein CERSUDRAFT_97034 [Gelatoporia subvermispora B]
MATVKVDLAPTPGFCVKTTALQDAVCTVSSPAPSPNTLDGPSARSGPISVPKGLKIFLNIAWDANVPPPPPGSDEAIQRAMLGDDDLDPRTDYFVPVVVSEPRQVTDKAGKPSIVLDAIYNASLKPRASKEPAFKTFLIELAFQRVEAQCGILLARQIGTPNIAAKGAIAPRAVAIPAALFPEGHPSRALAGADEEQQPRKTKLIEELDAPASTPPGAASPSAPKAPKGILKPPAASTPTAAEAGTPTAALPPPPELSWAKNGTGIQITLRVPGLERAHIPGATLDLEPRRLALALPPLYALDLDLDLPDAELPRAARLAGPSARQALLLKRHRALDVDAARAEWRVAEGVLVVHA